MVVKEKYEKAKRSKQCGKKKHKDCPDYGLGLVDPDCKCWCHSPKVTRKSK